MFYTNIHIYSTFIHNVSCILYTILFTLIRYKSLEIAKIENRWNRRHNDYQGMNDSSGIWKQDAHISVTDRRSGVIARSCARIGQYNSNCYIKSMRSRFSTPYRAKLRLVLDWHRLTSFSNKIYYIRNNRLPSNTVQCVIIFDLSLIAL